MGEIEAKAYVAANTTPLPVGVVTLVFTDLEGSSEASARHGAAFEIVRNQHFRLLRQALRESRGFEIETAGDALFAAFNEASAAVHFALAAQQAMRAFDWEALLPGAGAVRIRIGMHTGEPFIGLDEESGRPVFRGPVTNRAARVQSAAHGGQILLSEATRILAADALPSRATLLDCGIHRLKGVGEEHLWQLCHPELPCDFPPLCTLNPQRHNLPVPLTPLVGRENETKTWLELLHRPATRLLTLRAFGGMGKTRAALQLAEMCAGEAQLFKDGVWWVALDEARSGEAMIAAISESLRLQTQPDLSLKQQVWAFLRDRQLLLVLDNTEQIPDAGQIIAELLKAAPSVKCLVTTRHSLNLMAEEVCDVPPLSSSDAAQLFCERVRQVGSEAEADATIVRELCRRLEGVPLALELAASRAGALSLGEILERLDDRFRLLRSKAPDLPTRQQALRGTIDWSHEMLEPENQALFVELSVFSGAFTLNDAEAIVESEDAFDGVLELHRCSLLRAISNGPKQATRYIMLDSLRAYAAEKLNLRPDGGQQIRERHATYYASLLDKLAAQLRTSSEGEALAQSSLLLDNARAACEFALRSSNATLAGRLSLALGQLLHRSGAFREAAHRVGMGLQTIENATQHNEKLRADLTLAQANAYYDAFNWPEAENAAQQALTRYQDLQNHVGQADTINLLGLIALRGHKNYAAAQEYFSQATTLFQQANFPLGTALARNNQGLAEYTNDNLQAARPHYEAALSIYRERGYSRGIAEGLNNLGVIAQDEGNLHSAWLFYKDALEIESNLQNQFGIARCLYNLGEIAAAQKQIETAARLFFAAGIVFERIGSPFHQHAAQEFGNLNLSPELRTELHRESLRLTLQEMPLSHLINWACAQNTASP